MNKRLEKIAIYPGSFDPMTYGHLDVIERAAKLFDKLIVAVGQAKAKRTFFTTEERTQMIQLVCKKLANVEVEAVDSLTASFATQRGAVALVRGLRTEADYTYEMQMAMMNRLLASEVETVFIPTRQDYSHVPSTLVKEVASFGGDISSLVPRK